MAKHTQYSFGRLLLQIALGAMLVVGGIWALTGGGDFGVLLWQQFLKAVF